MPLPRYTVSRLTSELRWELAERYALIEVEGELGRITFHRSGHWYFSLKDRDALLQAVMFRGDNQRLRWRPREGERVLATGRLDLYPPQGRVQLLVRRMRRAGEGELAARLEALKRRLAAEGLFDPARKRPLPALPRAVGVVTSPTGAALQDILRVRRQRFPGLPVVLAPCRVQGEGAGRDVARAVELLGRHAARLGVDVLVVGRGGGAREDLSAFDEEVVVRAIAACPVPVVSAVGHEVDVTLADLAADRRAATPSHAAELVFPERDALLSTLEALEQELARAARQDLRRRRERLRSLRLVDPRQRLATARVRCDELESALLRSLRRELRRRRERLLSLRLPSPAGRIERERARCDELERRLAASALQGLAIRRRRLGEQAGRLRALSPLAVLERGYALVFTAEGRLVRRAAELAPGERLELALADGRVPARVEGPPEPGPLPGPA